MSSQMIDAFVDVRELHFHYRHWQPEKAGMDRPPVLLLHGLASALRIWDLVAPLLAEYDHEVFALDQRGHGRSSKPTSGYDFATIVADDAAVVNELGLQPFALIGHSWGAAVALDYAATHPQDVAALILVDGATGQLSARSGWTREQALKELAPPRFAGTSRVAFIERIKQGQLGQQWSAELEEILLNIVELRADDTVAPRLVFENHLQIIAAMWDQQTYDLYRRVRCPITLIVAESPRILDKQEEFFNARKAGIDRIQQLRPDVTIIQMSNTIHDIPLQRPEALARHIEQGISSL